MKLNQTPSLLIASLLIVPVMAGADDVTVEISHGNLSPAEASIEAGDKVTFVNTVDMPGGHSVAADDESFASPALQKNENWEYVFAQPGTYRYHVKEHSGVRGIIRVK